MNEPSTLGSPSGRVADWPMPALVRARAEVSVMSWSPAIVGAVLGLYGIVFETLMRTTPGKRLARCSVVAEGGGRSKASTILIRNAARIVEFHFPAIALLVLLTPSRQRLGDLLARTVVVQPKATPPDSTGGLAHSPDQPCDKTDPPSDPEAPKE